MAHCIHLLLPNYMSTTLHKSSSDKVAFNNQKMGKFCEKYSG